MLVGMYVFLRELADIVCGSIILGFVHVGQSDIGACRSIVLSD